MSKLATCLSAVILSTISVPAAFAQGTAAPAAAEAPAAPAAPVKAKRNQTIVDADGRVLGRVHEIDAAGGFVTFTAQMQVYRVPISTLSADGARLKTTMTRKAIGL